jgi:hypothetical protein
VFNSVVSDLAVPASVSCWHCAHLKCSFGEQCPSLLLLLLLLGKAASSTAICVGVVTLNAHCLL